MTEDQDAKDSQSDSGAKIYTSKSKDKKTKTQRPLTKIIMRRLPPSMTEQQFVEQVSPIPEHDFFYFAKPDPSLGNNVYSRAYINFINIDDIYLFRDKFDGYIFLDDKGVEYVGIVEYAPFQRVPKKKKKRDPKCGTIESDPIYQEFLESLKEQEPENQPKLEYSYPISDSNDKKVQTTPLLEYLAARKQDKRGRDERRRRENDKRKMRIERKGKDGIIKKPGDVSEEETYNEIIEYHSCKNNQSSWYGEARVYHKSRGKCGGALKQELRTAHGSDEFISTDSDWDSHFPALAKTHNTFTLTSGNVCDTKEIEESQKSGGDTYLKEEDGDAEVKKIKSREWEKEKVNDPKDDIVKSDKDGSVVFESKTFRDQRRAGSMSDRRKRDERRETDKKESREDEPDDRKRDKTKESREQKSKKYSDTRKERTRDGKEKSDFVKSEKQSAVSKMISTENKTKSINHDDIKPFTQLPQVKTDDLTKLIEGMERKAKLDAESNHYKESKENNGEIVVNDKKSNANPKGQYRRGSVDSDEMSDKQECVLRRQRSCEDRGKSTDREGSEDKEKSDSSERRAERRIRNKDRPSLVIYQPGMGRFSKQRLAKDAPSGKTVNDNEKRDT